VGTEGLVVKGKVHSAKVPDQDGLRLLLECARTEISSMKHLWLDAGYQGRGRRWAEEVIGLSVEVVSKSAKLLPEKLAKIWVGKYSLRKEEFSGSRWRVAKWQSCGIRYE
jgi:putative transposase